MGFLHKRILHILLIAALGILAYSNTFNVPFHLDDYDAILENPMIRDLNYFIEPSKAKEFIKDFAGSYRYNLLKTRYIGSLTFALNYKFHGLDITGYHVVNLFIHIVNALLVYRLIILTVRTPLLKNADLKHHSDLIALFGALFFVSHPIQTQAVTYITQRYASLATLFYLLSIVMYIQSRLSHTEEITAGLKRNRKFRLAVYYCVSIVSAVLAMKTKEMAFTLPIIIAIYEGMFFYGTIRKRVLYLIPFLLTMVIIPLTIIGTDKPLEDLIGTDKPFGDLIGNVSDTTRGQVNLSRLDYLFTQFRVIVTYIRLLFLPINQAFIYDYPIYYSLFDPNVIVSFLSITVILGAGVYLLYRSHSASLYSRLIAFGIFWFFISLSVESSIIPIFDVINEHRVYLPSVGAVIAFSAAIFYIAQLFPPRNNRTGVFLPSLCILLMTIVIILTAVTYARNAVWQDEVSLWEDTVKKSPDSAVAHNSLGIVYARQNRFDQAVSEYRKALRLKPDYAWAHNNLGAAYIFKGLLDMAINEYQAALHLKPDYAEASYNLAFAFIQKGNLDLARREVERTLAIKPDHYQARQLLNYIISNYQH